MSGEVEDLEDLDEIVGDEPEDEDGFRPDRYRLPLGANMSKDLLDVRHREDAIAKGKRFGIGERINVARRHLDRVVKEANDFMAKNRLMILAANVMAENKGLPLEADPVFRVTEEGLVYLESAGYVQPRKREEVKERAKRLGVDLSFLGHRFDTMDKYLEAIEKEDERREEASAQPDEVTISQVERVRLSKGGK